MSARISFGLVLLACAAWLGVGCGESGAPSAPPLQDTSPSFFDCDPVCPPSYACFDGQCFPACDPECPEGTRCQTDGSCAAELVDGPGDDFERNPCGGFGELEGIPGTTCGPCDTGHWLCETENRVDCADPTGLNACGVCGELPGVPGGVCADEQRWACAPDGELRCVDWFDANPCLGTEALGERLPGRPCGACHEGHYACTGLNETECVIPQSAPDVCECDPSSRPIACGSDAGICERGVRYCGADGLYGACVLADFGAACESDDDCADAREVCVDEQVHPYETIEDDCVAEGDVACARRVCRLPVGTAPCTSNDECRPTAACAGGVCRPMVTHPFDEVCNGIDDNCDGRIDDDDRRTEICGACPYNMMLIVNAGREFGRRRICIDIYEASRPDATATDAGRDDSRSASIWDVVPWFDASPEEAVAACAGAGYNAQVPGGVAERRLCVADEWPLACNLEGFEYPYGDGYTAGACNDGSLGATTPAATATFSECAYTVPGGRFPNYDFSGNVEEWVRGPEGVMLAGGSFRDSGEDLECLAVREWDGELGPWIGFRCCANSISVTEFQE